MIGVRRLATAATITIFCGYITGCTSPQPTSVQTVAGATDSIGGATGSAGTKLTRDVRFGGLELTPPGPTDTPAKRISDVAAALQSMGKQTSPAGIYLARVTDFGYVDNTPSGPHRRIDNRLAWVGDFTNEICHGFGPPGAQVNDTSCDWLAIVDATSGQKLLVAWEPTGALP